MRTNVVLDDDLMAHALESGGPGLWQDEERWVVGTPS
jgi:Arc/MetJ family transcription regulator